MVMEYMYPPWSSAKERVTKVWPTLGNFSNSCRTKSASASWGMSTPPWLTVVMDDVMLSPPYRVYRAVQPVVVRANAWWFKPSWLASLFTGLVSSNPNVYTMSDPPCALLATTLRHTVTLGGAMVAAVKEQTFPLLSWRLFGVVPPFVEVHVVASALKAAQSISTVRPSFAKHVAAPKPRSSAWTVSLVLLMAMQVADVAMAMLVAVSVYVRRNVPPSRGAARLVNRSS